jgi:hypothetical protein
MRQITQFKEQPILIESFLNQMFKCKEKLLLLSSKVLVWLFAKMLSKSFNIQLLSKILFFNAVNIFFMILTNQQQIVCLIPRT